MKLVYLDLNHWISFAKALSAHPDGAHFADTFTTCVSAAASGAAVFPISDAIYAEVSKIAQYRQRRDIREAIELLSGYAVVTARPVVTTHEVEALLDLRFGQRGDPINTMRYLDWGVERAFGKVGGFRVRTTDGRDVTAQVRDMWPDGPTAFDELIARSELELQRRVLDGPASEDDVNSLRARGWNPRAAFTVAGRRLTQEIEQVARFDSDPRWRRGRIRDVVSAREFLIELGDVLEGGLAARGATFEELCPTPEEGRRNFDAMPSFDVAVSMKTSYHRNPQHRWKCNDIHDIDALGSALPYCDVVVTDTAVAAHARRTGLAARLDTIVLSEVNELPAHL
jgi:hypothetical protein